MQANKEIGKIQNTTPTLIGRALELFLEEITKLSAHVALTNNDSKITPSHIKAALSTNGDNKLEKFTFLKEAMSKIPDFKVLTSVVDVMVEGNCYLIYYIRAITPYSSSEDHDKLRRSKEEGQGYRQEVRDDCLNIKLYRITIENKNKEEETKERQKRGNKTQVVSYEQDSSSSEEFINTSSRTKSKRGKWSY